MVWNSECKDEDNNFAWQQGKENLPFSKNSSFYLDTLYPLGQVPVLVLEDGEVIAQSHAIVRYLASEFDLYGKSSHDRVIIDQTLDTLKNVEENLFGSYFWTKDPEAKVCDSTC